MIDSPGGSLDVEESIVAMIELSKTPIWGFAMGQVASAASLIYLSCHKRYATPAAYWVFHQGSGAIQGNYGDMASAMKTGFIISSEGKSASSSSSASASTLTSASSLLKPGIPAQSARAPGLTTSFASSLRMKR